MLIRSLHLYFRFGGNGGYSQFDKITYRVKGSIRSRNFKGLLGIAAYDNTAKIKTPWGAEMQTIFSGFNQYLRVDICDKLVLDY